MLVKTRLDLDRHPHPPVYVGQEAERPYGMERLILKLDQVEEVNGHSRVKSYLVGWRNSASTRFTVRNEFDSIPVEVFTRYGGPNYCSLADWYSWLGWVPEYVVEVQCGDETLTFVNPEEAARQMTERGIAGLVTNPILLGIEIERAWSRREK